MHKRIKMLREKRKHANYKPNRRLDAKSSRGMIYENEELRLRTININAEVERGQSEIKSLKREREQLRREIWTLRDEYDKLENLLRVKGIDPDEFRDGFKDLEQNQNEDASEENQSDLSDCSCEECCINEKTEDEANANDQKIKETPINDVDQNEIILSNEQQLAKNQEKKSGEEHTKSRASAKERLKLNFDHLSVVSEAEETSELSLNLSGNSSTTPLNDLSAFLQNVDILSPLSYLQKLSPPLSHFETIFDKMNTDTKNASDTTLSKEKSSSTTSFNYEKTASSAALNDQSTETKPKHFFSPIRKKNNPHPDVLITTELANSSTVQSQGKLINSTDEGTLPSSPSFQTGGNLEELLQDIEALSKDIVDLQTNCSELSIEQLDAKKKPFRSELNLVLSYPTTELDSSKKTQLNESDGNRVESKDTSSPLSILTSTNNNKKENISSMLEDSNFSNMNFMPINANVPNFSSSNSIFCTVSAPSTPALERKLNQEKNKPSLSQVSTESNLGIDKKKQKRVSIINYERDEKNAINNQLDTKNAKDLKLQDNNHHSHIHKGHCHNHSQPRRRMSLDNTTTQNVPKHKNHRQISSDTKVHRRESNRSNNSFKKRSRSDSTFGGHDVDQGGGTSMSERYSNSIASSRESSTSLSMKSGKRRISITSYGDSKKIPWVSTEK